MTSYLDDKLIGGISEIDTFIVIYYYDSNDDYYDSEVQMVDYMSINLLLKPLISYSPSVSLSYLLRSGLKINLVLK